MPAGLQIWDSGGVLALEITDRLTRIIGRVNSGSTPGSIQVPAFSGYGTPWAFVHQSRPTADYRGKRMVRVTISGTTLSWDFPGLSSWDIVPGTIVYGVF